MKKLDKEIKTNLALGEKYSKHLYKKEKKFSKIFNVNFFFIKKKNFIQKSDKKIRINKNGKKKNISQLNAELEGPNDYKIKFNSKGIIYSEDNKFKNLVEEEKV